MAELRFLPAAMPKRRLEHPPGHLLAPPQACHTPTESEPASVNPIQIPIQIPILDGVRALAVTLVFLAHSGLEGQVPGGLGVTVFFVLSGYLITTLLRREHAVRAAIDLRAFYLRRLLRLSPPLVVVVLTAAVLGQVGWIEGRFSIGGFLAALSYLGNLHAITQDFHGLPAGIGVVWSLAIEEHFYLLYPLLAVWLMRRSSASTTVALLVGLCLLVLFWRFVLAVQGAQANRIDMGTDTRIDAILTGCALAFWRPPETLPTASPASPRPARLAGLQAGLLVALLLASAAWRDPFYRETLRYTLQAAAVAGLLHLGLRHAGAWPVRWLDQRWLAWLGSVSYTIYLAHHVILLGVARHWPTGPWAARTGLALLLTLAVAALMRWAVEQPVLRWRARMGLAGTLRIPPGAIAARSALDEGSR